MNDKKNTLPMALKLINKSKLILKTATIVGERLELFLIEQSFDQLNFSMMKQDRRCVSKVFNAESLKHKIIQGTSYVEINFQIRIV